MTPNELDRVAHQLIADKIGAGEIVQMHWAVQELISRQGEIMGEGVPFFTLCAREHVYRVVKKVVDKYEKPQFEDQQQLTLEGYECLQQAYTVERDEERQLVPIHLITDDELLARAQEFRRQAGGLMNHANEIETYVAKRSDRVELFV
jgi:hypothetical protein